jgi:1,2-diacylglycerol 3-alpha-glucosyltransferase
MRIMHFTDAPVSGVNGVATSLGLLSRALREDGHDNLVVSSGRMWRGDVAPLHGEDEVWWVQSVKTGMGDFRYAVFPSGLLPPGSLRDRVRDWRPDVVHVHTPGPLGLAGLGIARRLGIPAVYTYHTDLHGYSEHHLQVPASILRARAPMLRAWGKVYMRHLPQTPKPASGWYEALEASHGRVLSAARVVIAPTAGALRRCRDAAYQGKVRVIATPHPALPAEGSGAEFRASHGIAADAPVALFVGRLSPEKNVGLLLAAFTLLRERLPEARLVLVGPQSRNLGLGDLLKDRTGIVTTGVLRGRELAAAYRAADVFAFPSVTDTQGIVLNEAAAAGVPSIIVDELLHAGHPLAPTMRLTRPMPEPFADAIAGLLREPGEAARLGREAKLLADGHTPRAFGAEVLRAYEEAVRVSVPVTA